MSPTLFIILFSIVIFGVAFSAIYLLYQLLTNFQPGKNRVLADFRKMREEVKTWTQQLIPWNQEEMSLLSLRQVNQKVKRGLLKTAKGVYTSIYHEPLIVYNYRKYISTKKNAILYARTSKNEFAYRMWKNKVDINIDGQFVGTLKDNGEFVSGRRNRLLAKINQDDTLPLYPVQIGKKEVASVASLAKTTKHNPRAFQFLQTMEEKEEKVFTALAIFKMVNESLEEEF